MIIPELPSFLKSLGGEAYQGLIIALFTLTAGISRPFSGKLTDTIGRKPIILFGMIVSTLSTTVYPFITTITAFFTLRIIHGLSTGFTPTGTSAYIADLIPIHQRGEALGIFGFASSLGMMIGPVIGSEIAFRYSHTTMFYTAATITCLSTALILTLKETLKETQPFHPKLLALKRNELYEPRVMPVVITTICLLFAFGAVITLTPTISTQLGLQNKALFIAMSTLSSTGFRIIVGKISDRKGRLPVLLIASVILTIAMTALAFTTTAYQFLAIGLLYGIAIGSISPTLIAWTVDLSLAHKRGRGLATMYMALEAGIGTGAFLSGTLYAGNIQNLHLPFLLSATLALIAIAYMLYYKHTTTQTTPPTHP
jgi:MFS family permease